jgi:hypothetical protein
MATREKDAERESKLSRPTEAAAGGRNFTRWGWNFLVFHRNSFRWIRLPKIKVIAKSDSVPMILSFWTGK